MENYTVPKDKLSNLIKEIQNTHFVFGPVKSQDIIAFSPIKDPSEITLDYLNSKLPPKSFMMNQTETLFKFTTGETKKIEPAPIPDEKIAIFGIRPCDARSFDILDPMFKSDFEDPYYLTKRKNTILIGLSCNEPGVNCFCTSLDDGPTSAKHVDILLTDIGDAYYVEANTDRGKELVKKLGKHLTKASEGDAKKKKETGKKAEGKITRALNPDGIVEKLEDIFDDKYWKDVSLRCLSCGACTYLCPTCHCFDIQDETTANRGARIRVWDTCMNPEYTLHASGYNPRPERKNRTRNRIYHKYNYYPKNFDVIACVGCGRCINNCAVNIDIIDVITKAREVKT